MYAYKKKNLESRVLMEIKKQEFLQLLFLLYPIQELASLCGYSASGFIKTSNHCFRCSPYRWMQEQRARHIRLDINAGVLSLKELARKYHFSSYQHFSEFCKLHFGAPPTQIRGKRIIAKVGITSGAMAAVPGSAGGLAPAAEKQIV